eukprot:scaffold31978_cov30-Tisochrysis_lutea.AAC.1
MRRPPGAHHFGEVWGVARDSHFLRAPINRLEEFRGNKPYPLSLFPSSLSSLAPAFGFFS